MEESVKGSTNGAVTVVAVGDVVISRQPPETAFARIGDELQSGTFACCNFEVPLSNKGLPQPGKFETLHAGPGMIEGFVQGGFKVVSLANNHSMDYGPEALLDSLALLDERGICHAGAGRNAEEAWRPAFFTAGGMRFAFLSFATESFLGYGAHALKPGIAAIRRDPLYGPTCVNPDDQEAMEAKVRQARAEADFVIAAFHWGLSQSRALTVSQLTLGHAAVDAGAGLVIGHHPHVLQGVEAYRGSLICFSLGNFVFDLMPEFLGPATRDTMLVKVRLAGHGVAGAEFLPVWINDEGQPEPLPESHAKNGEILGLLQRLSAARGTMLSRTGGVATVTVQQEP